MLPQMLALLLLISPGQSDPPSKPPQGATTQPGEGLKADKKTTKRKHGKADSKDRSRALPPRNLAVRAMNMVIENAEFKDVSFEDFVEWLERMTQASVVVNWKALEKAGVERDRPISLKAKGIKLRKLLPLVFAQLTEDLRDVELAAKADDNILMISTKADINAKLITRVYDIEDLLVSVPDFAGGSLELSTSGWRLGDRFYKGGGWEKSRTKEEIVERLISIITTQVQPSSWKVNGGKGTIRYFQGRLVVRNSIEAHQELGGYISSDVDPGQDDEQPAPSSSR